MDSKTVGLIVSVGIIGALCITVGIMVANGKDPKEVIQQTTQFFLSDILNLHDGTKNDVITGIAIKGCILLTMGLIGYALSFLYQRKQFTKITTLLGAQEA